MSRQNLPREFYVPHEFYEWDRLKATITPTHLTVSGNTPHSGEVALKEIEEVKEIGLPGGGAAVAAQVPGPGNRSLAVKFDDPANATTFASTLSDAIDAPNTRWAP